MRGALAHVDIARAEIGGGDLDFLGRGLKHADELVDGGAKALGEEAAAGMVQPLLLPLGLGTETGAALAALAVGAGAMTASHVNDEYFWLVSVTAGFSPMRGLGTVTVGTLLQGLVAVAVLVALAVIGAGF